MKHVSTILAVVLSVLALCPSVLGKAMADREVSDAMGRGYAAIKVKDFESAKTAFASVVKDGVGSSRVPEAMMTLGSLQLKTDKATAVNTYTLLAKLYPNAPEAAIVMYRVGSLNIRDKYYRDAQDACRAVATNKGTCDLNRGRASLQIGFIDVMKYWADEYWDRANDGTPYLVRPSETGDKKQYLESAGKQFETTRELYAKSKSPEIAAVADVAVGEIHILSHEPSLAETAYRRALDGYGSMPDKLVTLAHYGLGQALYGQGDLSGALEQFDQALSKFAPGGLYGFGFAPKKALSDIYAWKVLSLYGLKHFDEALAVAQQARTELEKDSELRDSAVNMDLWEGLILCQMDKTSDGLSVLHNVIDEHPDTPYAIRARSVIPQFEKGDN
jgi:TolA-binding protein